MKVFLVFIVLFIFIPNLSYANESVEQGLKQRREQMRQQAIQVRQQQVQQQQARQQQIYNQAIAQRKAQQQAVTQAVQQRAAQQRALGQFVSQKKAQQAAMYQAIQKRNLENKKKLLEYQYRKSNQEKVFTKHQLRKKAPVPKAPVAQAEDEVVNLAQIWDMLEESSTVWTQIMDVQPKSLTVEKYIRYYEANDIYIRKPTAFYVEQIDAMAESNPKLLDKPFYDVLMVVAIMEYDFDNGFDPEAMARQLLGEEGYGQNEERLQ